MILAVVNVLADLRSSGLSDPHMLDSDASIA